MKINLLIDVADKLDRSGLEKEASQIDEFIKSAAKIPMHKCGLKQETVDMHEELLEGYRKALESYRKEYKKTMNSANEKDSPNSGKLREVMRNISHNCNAVCLHEIYFDTVINCKPFPLEKNASNKDLIKTLFDGKLEQEMKRVAMVTRNGWVMLNFCTTDKKLYLDICDLHEIGVSTTCVPVLALDMWEHAYVNDFGLEKEAYVNWYFERIDWRIVCKKVKNLMRIK